MEHQECRARPCLRIVELAERRVGVATVNCDGTSSSIVADRLAESCAAVDGRWDRPRPQPTAVASSSTNRSGNASCATPSSVPA